MESFWYTDDRLSRTSYAIRILIIAIPLAIIDLALNWSVSREQLLLYLIINLVASIMMIIQSVKRLHDIGLSGTYWVLFLIPLVNIGLGLYLMFKKGINGKNEYGFDPKGKGGNIEIKVDPKNDHLINTLAQSKNEAVNEREIRKRHKSPKEKSKKDNISSEISDYESRKTLLKNSFNEALLSEEEYQNKSKIIDAKIAELNKQLEITLNDEKEKLYNELILQKIESKVLQLNKLLEEGLISQVEFEQKKKKLLKEAKNEYELSLKEEDSSTYKLEKNEDSLWGYKNLRGNLVINYQFEDAFNFHEGLASVIINGKRGFINKQGDIVIKAIFDRRGSYFKNGKAEISLNGETFFIDVNGKRI
jgi:uncharacterized membrane protein YhaH (DUF805 family)